MIFSEETQDLDLVSDINMVPFIDIMLVLLVMFMITAPVLTSQLDIQLPQGISAENKSIPDPIIVFLDANGQLALNEQQMDKYEFEEKLAAIALQKPQPALHLEADKNTKYQFIMDILVITKNAGVNTLSFVFETQE